ncbi:MAG: hypothetical protein L6W00_13020 [Lentisphaeria bacterium]|nr:MAG: hypothetical protein L6W00_13020 [Lentisphaeria bacterium]
MHADWPDKIHSDSDFIRAVEREKKFNRPRLSGWNKYGGWAKGPQLKATGSFYVTKYEGKWFLVDPEGRLFFSHGVNAVTTQAKAKERRPFWYEKAAVRRPGGMLDFAEDNLKRKYGPEFRKRYPAVIADRFRSVGVEHPRLLERSGDPRGTAHSLHARFRAGRLPAYDQAGSGAADGNLGPVGSRVCRGAGEAGPLKGCRRSQG